jgi:PAS domain S-box-containing protein
MGHELSRLVDTLPGLVWTALADGHVDFVNQGWCEYTGLSRDEVRGLGWQRVIHSEDLPQLLERWRSIQDSGKPGDMEARLRRFDGEYRWFLIRTSPVADASGRIVTWCGVNTDIDDRRREEEDLRARERRLRSLIDGMPSLITADVNGRKRAAALLAGEKRVLEMVVSGRSLPVVLDALCQLFDVTDEESSSSVHLYDRTGTRILHTIGPGLAPSYKEFLDAGLPGCPDGGPCAIAASQRAQVIVSDVASDTRWERTAWPAVALAHGLKSCWSSPILSLAGELLGTCAFYQREARSPSPFHQALIQRFTEIARMVIYRTRSVEALKRSEALLKEAQRLSSTASFSWRVATNEITWSEEAYRIYGLDPAAPVTLEAILSRTHPMTSPCRRTSSRGREAASKTSTSSASSSARQVGQVPARDRARDPQPGW